MPSPVSCLHCVLIGLAETSPAVFPVVADTAAKVMLPKCTSDRFPLNSFSGFSQPLRSSPESLARFRKSFQAFQLIFCHLHMHSVTLKITKQVHMLHSFSWLMPVLKPLAKNSRVKYTAFSYTVC